MKGKINAYIEEFRRKPGETTKDYILSLLPTSEWMWWIIIGSTFAVLLMVAVRIR